jgi:hypothetical protein
MRPTERHQAGGATERRRRLFDVGTRGQRLGHRPRPPARGACRRHPSRRPSTGRARHEVRRRRPGAGSHAGRPLADQHLASGLVVSRSRRDFHAAVGELARVAAWIAYDAERQPLARQLTTEALMHSRLAGDRHQELFELSQLAMQNIHLGRRERRCPSGTTSSRTTAHRARYNDLAHLVDAQVVARSWAEAESSLLDVLAELGEMASTRTRVILRGTATAIAQAGGRASSTAADAGHDLLRQLVEWLTRDQALVWPH